MSQEVKIGVNADTTAAETSVKALDRAAEGAAGSVADISAAAKEAIVNLGRMEAMARRLKSTQDILSREFGRPISAGDAQTALGNFDSMRKGRGVGRRMLRGFDDFESWYLGHGTAYRRPQDAEAHRRFVMAQTMQGTADSRQNGAPPPPPPEDGGGGGPPPSPFDRGIRRAGSSALGFGKSMLAMAGITSVAAMAGQAVDYSTEESVGTDTLKRRMGDLGVDFDKLRDQARGAASGLGVTYVEASRLAQQFSREAGNLTGRDLAGRNFQGSLRAGIGFSRSFGLDPAEGTQFFGTMHRLGIATDEQSSRKLGLTIADAIAKGGYGGKADEVLAAVADFSTQVSRISLSGANVTAYAGGMSSLMGMGYAGLDPAGAASILGTADAAMRRGGAKGEASLNFSYAMLYKDYPGIGPITGQAINETGLFGTTRQLFGQHDKGKFNSAYGAYAATHGMAIPKLDDKTNFERMMAGLHQSYGDGEMFLGALAGHTGLSINQAAALAMMKPNSLHNMTGMLDNAGVKLGDIKDSAYAGLAAIAGADGLSGLKGIAGDTLKRKDLSTDERAMLAKLAAGNDPEALKNALVKIIGTHDQVETDATKTRQSITDLKDVLTTVGGTLVGVLNPIRDAVTSLAMALGTPEYKRDAQNKIDGATDYVGKYRSGSKDAAVYMDGRYAGDQASADRMLAKGMSPDDILNAQTPHPGMSMLHGPGAAPDQYGRMMAQRQALTRYLGQRVTSGRLRQLGWDSADAAAITGNLDVESRFDPMAVEKGGGPGRGLAQWGPDRWAKFQAWCKANGRDPNARTSQIDFVNYELRHDYKGAADHMRAAKSLADKAKIFMQEYERPKDDSSAGARVADAMAANGTPLPANDPESKSAGSTTKHEFSFGPAELTLRDPQRNELGRAVMQPQAAAPRPAGVR